MLSKNFYIIAIIGLVLLLANFLLGNWIMFNLSHFDYQNFYRKYAFIEISIIVLNCITISLYCYKKKLWIALLSFILIDSFNLINAIDTYFYFAYYEPILVKDNNHIKFMGLIVPTIHFVLIGLSMTRKFKWLMFYSVTGLIGHFIISVLRSKELFTFYELLCYVFCFTTVLIILNYRDEIRLLKKKESDQILDME